MPTKVSEKADSYLDSLRMGLEVWEKQLMLGGELDVWAAVKLGLFAASHPFSSEKEVFQMKVWKSTCCCCFKCILKMLYNFSCLYEAAFWKYTCVM